MLERCLDLHSYQITKPYSNESQKHRNPKQQIGLGLWKNSRAESGFQNALNMEDNTAALHMFLTDIFMSCT